MLHVLYRGATRIGFYQPRMGVSDMDIRFECNGEGQIRIATDLPNVHGHWFGFRDVAVFEDEGRTFIAVSDHFSGTEGFKPETVYELTELIGY